jgi:aspartate aminotransferase-like enzyme
LLCDGISAAFSDEFDAGSIDALIIGSQKGLGLAPGMCFIVLSEQAVDFLRYRKICTSMYYDFNSYIDNMKRGQTPFTPSLTILYQLDRALDDIDADGGLGTVTARRKTLADRFRMRLDGHGIQYIRRYVSNCVTVIQTGSIDAELIVEDLSNTYNITVATNSPPLKKTHFRVSHMGNNTPEDMDCVADAIGLCMKERS